MTAKANFPMHRPLLICDADEVLVHFVAPFEQFLAREGYLLSLETFALSGNIRRRTTGEAASEEQVRTFLFNFFETSLESAPAVTGAAAALGAIAQIADIVILTNIDEAHRQRRAAALAALGMPYPVLANQGGKGKAVKSLVQERRAPALFVDDFASHHKSVASIAPSVHRLHFIADARLHGIAPAAPDAHARIDAWDEALPYILGVLG